MDDRPTIIIGLDGTTRHDLGRMGARLRKELPGYNIVLVPGLTSARVVVAGFPDGFSDPD